MVLYSGLSLCSFLHSSAMTAGGTEKGCDLASTIWLTTRLTCLSATRSLNSLVSSVLRSVWSLASI